MTSTQHFQYQYQSSHGLGAGNYSTNSSVGGSSPASTPPPPSLSIPIVSLRSSHQLSTSPNRVLYCSSPISSGPQTPVGLRGFEDMFAGGLCNQEPFVWLPPQSQQLMNVSAAQAHLTMSAPVPSLQVSPVPSPNSSYYYPENAQSAFVFPPTQQYVYAPIPPQFTMAMQPPSPTGGYTTYSYQQQQPAARLYMDNQSNHSGSAQSSPIKGAKSKLPTCYLTESGEIGINIGMVVDRELIEQFACDKTGCHFLQAQYPICKVSTRQKIFDRVVLNDDVFTMLVRDVFGNFLIQKMLEVGNAKELNDLAARLSNDKYGQDRLYSLCQDRYSCRVVQKAIECLSDSLRAPMIISLYGREIALTLDQNGNHVIQRILHHFSPTKFKFVIDAYVADKETLRKVVENKYGCRVVQVALEELCAAPDGKHELRKLLTALLNDCNRFVSNEFANYVMQHIIVTDSLADEREYIIEHCIRGNVLDMSQDKFASHVVEKAFKHASRVCISGQSSTLDMLMMEVFKGYLRDQQGREALDVMMFDQFGNYVVQTMLVVAADMRQDKQRAIWFEQLANRVAHNQSRLVKYSSGKKIIEQLKCIMGPSKSFAAAESVMDENQNTPTFASKYGRAQYGGIPLPCAYRGY